MARAACDIDWGDRRELWFMLKKLDERQRLAFLDWCCRQTQKLGSGVRTRVTDCKGHLGDVWHCLCLLAFAHGLDWKAAGSELDRRLRRL